MLSERDVLWSILVPGAVALVFTIAAVTLLGNRAWVAALAIGAAFLVAFPAISGGGTWRWPDVPPTDSSGWLIVVGFFATILGVIDALVRLRWWARLLCVVIVTAISVALLLKFKFRAGTWSPMHGTAVIAACALVAGIWWAAIEDCADRHTVATPILLWLIGCCIAVISLMVGIQSYGKYSLTLAAGSMAIVPAMLWRGSRGSLRGVASVFSVLLVALLIGELFLSEIGVKLIAILCLTPLFIPAGRWFWPRANPWKRAAARIAIALVPLATAVAIAAARFQHNEQDRDDSGSYYH